MKRIGIWMILLLAGSLMTLEGARNPDWLKNLRPKTLPQFVVVEDPDIVILRDEKETVIGTRGTFTTDLLTSHADSHERWYQAGQLQRPILQRYRQDYFVQGMGHISQRQGRCFQ